MLAPLLPSAKILAEFIGGILQSLTAQGFGRLTSLNAIKHPLQQVLIVFFAVGLGIEVDGDLGKMFITNAFDVFLHKAIVITPIDAGGANCRLFRARSYLMGVQIMQSELIYQSLLDLLMQEEKPVGIDSVALVLKR
jgi:hypothetical protein